MIAVCMTLMRSSTVKPFPARCGLSDLERDRKKSAEFSRQERLRKSSTERGSHNSLNLPYKMHYTALKMTNVPKVV